jgi:hypothetical protein
MALYANSFKCLRKKYTSSTNLLQKLKGETISKLTISNQYYPEETDENYNFPHEQR